MKINMRIWPIKMTGEDLENLMYSNHFLYEIINNTEIYINDEYLYEEELIFSSKILENNLSFPPRNYVIINGKIMESDVIYEINNLNKYQIFYLFDIIDIDAPLSKEIEYDGVVNIFKDINFKSIFNKFNKLGIHEWGKNNATLEEKRFDIIFDFDYIESEDEDSCFETELSLFGYINKNKKLIKI